MTGPVVVEVATPQADTRSRPLPFILAKDIKPQTDIDYLIEGYIERSTANLLYAPKDHFKTFVKLDQLLSIASGLPWCGRDVKRGLAVFITGEGHGAIDRRVMAWAIARDIDYRQLKFARSTIPTQVLSEIVLLDWVDYIRRVADHFGEAPAVVGIDTLATNFGPGNQNDPSDMSRFVANIKTFLIGEFGCAVETVHHSGKDLDRGARGGGSIEADSDAVFYLERIKDTDNLVALHCKHVKDGEKPPSLTLQARTVELGTVNRYGDPVTSLVMAPHLTDRQQAIVNHTGAGKSQRQIAEFFGVDKRVVSREIGRLKLMGLWPHGPGTGGD